MAFETTAQDIERRHAVLERSFERFPAVAARMQEIYGLRLPRHVAVAAYLHERDGDLATAAQLYAEAARLAPHLAERDHLTRQAARLNARRDR